MKSRLITATFFGLALSMSLFLALIHSPAFADGTIINIAADGDAFAGIRPARVGAAPVLQQSCTLPATATTADQLYDCITAANAGGGGTITLGADIDLTTLTTSLLPRITSALTVEGAGYAIDGGGSKRIFDVGGTGHLTVNQATLRSGSAPNGGAVYNEGSLMVTNSTLSGNSASAGGIYNNGGTLTVNSSTFSGNSEFGIFHVYGTLTVTNSTFSGNSGGGILHIDDTLTVTNSTFSGNSGWGIISYAQLYLAGNIFADRPSGPNCYSLLAINDNGYNLSDDDTCTNGGTGSVTNATLNLGALADNGGPTLTHLPGAGSDAIGAVPYWHVVNNNGETLACNGTTTDQTGNSRPINAGTACTSGAAEVALPGTSLTIIKDANPAGATDFDFTIYSTPLPSYSGSTSGNPFWTRPNEGTTCTLSTNSVRYHVQAFMVDTSGNYSMVSQQNYNGYLHLYQDSFNPIDQCANYLNGSDDTGLGGNQSEIYNQTLEPDTYSISELLPNIAWNLTGASCTGASGSVSLTDETLSVEVALGEAVQCTFTNESLCPASWTVNTADELSACITLANTNGASLDTITLGADIDLTTLTTSPLPQITSTITVEGAGHFIDGGWDGVPASGTGMRIFHVMNTGDLTVNQATLQNGNASVVGASFNNGGAIWNQWGGLTVTDTNLSGNTADAGGAIFNDDETSMTVVNSVFSGNSVSNGQGGAIYNYTSTATVTNSTFSENSAESGGAIDNWLGTLTIINSTFSSNTATNEGGAIATFYGTVTATNSTFSSNTATNNGGAVVSEYGTVTVTSSTFSGNTRPIISGADCTAGAVEVEAAAEHKVYLPLILRRWP